MEKKGSYQGVLVLFLIIAVPLLLMHQNSFSNSLWSLPKLNATISMDDAVDAVEDNGMPSTTSNKLLDGLLPLGFDLQSCLSRYESHLYRKSSPYKPSPRLISKLRSYELLHKRCGPNSWHYNATVANLATTGNINTTYDCNYVVALPINGLGNRMISIASTFLYAILTDRVLLVAFEEADSDLFCEPFLDSTWQLPSHFPHWKKFNDLPTYGSLVEKVIGNQNAVELANSMAVPPFLRVDLNFDRPLPERFFHCGEGQMILNRVPFLILKSDQYIAPSLFMVPSFERELNAMFPKKDTVFHHLGRYLFTPSNEPWTQITQFYNANLSKADKKVGIQVRVFSPKVTPSKTVTEQILSCTKQNNILPQVDQRTEIESRNKTTVSYNTTMAVLVTSLYKEYSENLRVVYSAGPTTRGEAVQVYQPSHEGVQRFNNNSHNVEALTEMYLLSLCDELVTSGQSTFGYVAQGLRGIEPWIMHKTVGTEFSDPPCVRALSMEPCYHFPPRYDCKGGIKVNHLSSVFTHIRQCEDIDIGMKMV